MQNTTDTLYRRSPVMIERRPKTVGRINGFAVVLEYEDESQKKGPALVDLSHLAKWDVQGADLSAAANGEAVPTTPGECRLQEDRVVFRMNRTQAGIWHLCKGDPPGLPENPSYTDITDAWALFGLAGEAIPALFEHITELDLVPPAGPPSRFIQGPILQVPSRIVVINRSNDSAVAMIAFARGFGQSVAQALLETGSGIGLHIAGVNAFYDSLRQMNG